jgi:hypothetical protein
VVSRNTCEVAVSVSRLACLGAVAVAILGGCGGGAEDSPRALGVFQRRALAAIHQVTNAGIGFRGRAMFHLRAGMRDKGRAAAAGAATLSRVQAPRAVGSLRDRIVAVLRKLHRDFTGAGKRRVEDALAIDAADTQRLDGLRSAVVAVPSY